MMIVGTMIALIMFIVSLIVIMEPFLSQLFLMTEIKGFQLPEIREFVMHQESTSCLLIVMMSF